MGRRKGDPHPDRRVQVTPEENADFILHNLEVSNLATNPVDFNDPDGVAQRIQEYFATCIKNGRRPQVAGLALAFGVDRRTLWKWRTGVTRANAPDASRQQLQQATAILNALIEDYMQEGKINPIAGIFLMKNHFDYKDQREEVRIQENPLGVEASREELSKKYLNAVNTPDSANNSDGMQGNDGKETIGE